MMGSVGESLVLFFLFFRLVLGVVTTLARFLPKALVNVVDVAEMPMVVVVVALGGSMGTSGSENINKEMIKVKWRPFYIIIKRPFYIII